jgi:hypothetical protein
MINYDDVERIYKDLLESEDLNPENIVIVGMSQNRYFTLKSLGESDMSQYDEEYLANKPEDVREMLK